MELDRIDLDIIDMLKEDAVLSRREIGRRVHLTGQAVGMRIGRLMEEGVIQGFTVRLDGEKLGIRTVAFVKVYMKTHDHGQVLELIGSDSGITEAHRVSSDACYLLKVEVPGMEDLNALLGRVSGFANYQLLVSVQRVK
ncbi:Lrp/AsnC family transcriptional regulator [Aminomonas paucivorans]|uniref:Lrp/AsnC family transcriptional regulator n=1 Tax=Aminomonas paucivorans TaxID=81412 RepID=UPI003320B659